MQMGVKRVISIHALREEGDLNPPTQEKRPTNFYPRPPRGGRLQLTSGKRAAIPISIHALREEGDHLRCRLSLATSLFLSTPSARRATGCFISFWCLSEISIHALREEGDGTHSVNDSKSADFYPRPPRGGRHERNGNFEEAKEFLSTPSARRATRSAAGCAESFPISIHALREEGDRSIAAAPGCPGYFYPRPPRGGRPTMPPSFGSMERISIHALREEGDWPMALMPARALHFYPRPPRGGRLRSGTSA